MSVPWFPFYTADFFAGTQEMDGIDRAVYLLMLAYLYSTRRPLPADPQRICRALQIHTGNHSARVRRILGAKWVLTEAGWINQRAVEVMEEQEKALKAKSSGGKRGAALRWGKPVSEDLSTGTPNGIPNGVAMGDLSLQTDREVRQTEKKEKEQTEGPVVTPTASNASASGSAGEGQPAAGLPAEGDGNQPVAMLPLANGQIFAVSKIRAALLQGQYRNGFSVVKSLKAMEKHLQKSLLKRPTEAEVTMYINNWVAMKAKQQHAGRSRK